MLNLVTGYRGTPHITAEDEASRNAGIFGAGVLVLEGIGDELGYSVQSHNSVRVLSGDIVAHGRHIRLAGYEDCTIATGTQSLKRIDLICLKYEKDSGTGIENISIVVKKGTASATPVDAEYTAGNILEGDTLVEIPLYRVNIEGLEIVSVESLFDIFFAGGSGAKQVVKNITVPASGWIDERETTAMWRCRIEHEAILEGMEVEVEFNGHDKTEEQVCSYIRATNGGVLKLATSKAGYVDIYAADGVTPDGKKIVAPPTTDLLADLKMMNVRVVS